MHIDRYEFGLIVIDGQTFRNDILIWPGRIKGDWWRQEGHLLQVDDVAEALAVNPEVLVVGRGDPGKNGGGPGPGGLLKGPGGGTDGPPHPGGLPGHQRLERNPAPGGGVAPHLLRRRCTNCPGRTTAIAIVQISLT